MSLPTMIMRPNMHDITAPGHQARVMAFSQKAGRWEVSSGADLFIHDISCGWHCHQLVTKPGQWPSSKESNKLTLNLYLVSGILTFL